MSLGLHGGLEGAAGVIEEYEAVVGIAPREEGG
ncbi:hypothetical protein FHX42_004888 [Saccharopolyspora lacisalsi]|uniref:Uncharacterized protein n=1 Tax=Halosaccharopolyspora lacisalsi TaxID=1000566 RepID=A0A839DZX0_9PSEU|nr:hypothetical protein [Halosaccharopolyspora lacisalsi]